MSEGRKARIGLRCWIIGIVALGTVLNYLARSTLSVAAPTLKTEFDMTTEQYSWVVMLPNLGTKASDSPGETYYFDDIKLETAP